MVNRYVPLLLAILLGFGNLASAQTVQYHARGGLFSNSARIVDKHDGTRTETGSRQGFSLALGMKADFDHRLFFAPRLQYNNVAFDVKSTDTKPAESYHLHYIDIPILFHVDLGKELRKGFYAEFGPSFGAAVMGIHKTGSTKETMVFSMTQFNRINVTALGAVGYHFKNGLFVDAGYTYGLVSITNGDTKPKMRTAQAGLGVGYYFKSRKG